MVLGSGSVTSQREEAEERAEDFIPMFEVGDIQALAEATDHSVSFLLLGPQVGLGAGRLEFVLEVLPTTESKDVLKGALALQQPFSHPPCPLKLVSAQAIPLPCW